MKYFTILIYIYIYILQYSNELTSNGILLIYCVGAGVSWRGAVAVPASLALACALGKIWY